MRRPYFLVLGLSALVCCNARSLGGADGGSNDANTIVAPTVPPTTINGVVYSASSLIGGATIDPNHFWPPTGQDCAVELGHGQVPTAPPQAFLDECAGCHTALGTGTGNFPNITGQHDYNTLVATVRNGIQGGVAEMPAFKTAWLNDDNLMRIYAFLSQSPITDNGPCTPIPPMTASDISAASTAGLAAWREFDGKTDPNGLLTNVACVQCHAPDPLDIAYYGYSDGDILRRGTAHLPASHVANIVDMVHALRTQYNIGRRDPLAVRPFQPSSIVLQGNTIAARDEAFMQQLVDMQLIVATRPINSVSDANTAMNQVWGIDRHTMPIPIPYDRYTEDQFHNPPGYISDCTSNVDMCDDHGSIADWVSVVPHTVSDYNTYFSEVDKYIADPNLATYTSVNYWTSTSSEFGTYDGNSYGTGFMDHDKYVAETMANYCIRLELMGRPTCYEQGVTPFPNMSNIWGVGADINLYGTGYEDSSCDTTWTDCAAGNSTLPQWQWFELQDITPGATLSSNFSRMRHVWMNLWWTHFDPTLLVTNDPTAAKDEYYTRSIYWSNLNDWLFAGAPAGSYHATYAAYNAYQVMVHNVATLVNPQLAECSRYPGTDFPCTTVDLRSGLWPNLINFAEQNQPQLSESVNNIHYQIMYEPSAGPYRAQYQMLVTNMYRMFFWSLIGQLQQDNWMCDPTQQNLRIQRAQLFFAQAETQASNKSNDDAMFAMLASLMSNSRSACPPLTSTP